MIEPGQSCDCDIFSPCEFHYVARPLDDVTYDTVQIELLRWELMKWKKKHSQLLEKIEIRKKQNKQLTLDVTTWQARFLSLAAKFRNLKNISTDLEAWFSTTTNIDE